MRKLASQFARFGLVGAGGFVLDFAVFNILRATLLNPDTVHEGPVIAKIISTAIAIVFNWIGNRHWTFREHRGPQLLREGIQFGIVSVGGMLIGLGCLFISHYLLGFTSVLADNISSNVIGLGLGTLFRFTFYRLWVFAPHRGEPAPAIFEEEPAVFEEETDGVQASAAESATALPTPLSRRDPAVLPRATAPADGAPRSG